MRGPTWPAAPAHFPSLLAPSIHAASVPKRCHLANPCLLRQPLLHCFAALVAASGAVRTSSLPAHIYTVEHVSARGPRPIARCRGRSRWSLPSRCPLSMRSSSDPRSPHRSRRWSSGPIVPGAAAWAPDFPLPAATPIRSVPTCPLMRYAPPTTTSCRPSVRRCTRRASRTGSTSPPPTSGVLACATTGARRTRRSICLAPAASSATPCASWSCAPPSARAWATAATATARRAAWSRDKCWAAMSRSN